MSAGFASFDTVKTLVPIDGVNGFDSSVFKQHVEFREGEVVSESLKLAVPKKDKPVGLTTIQIEGGGALLHCSAKILGERYYEGINGETVQLIADRLRESNIVDIDPQALLESSIRTIDCTRNIHPKDVRRSVQALHEFASLNRRWRADDYSSGVVLRRRSTSANERLICYDKVTEMGRSKEAVNLGIDRFKGVLRVEANMRNFDQVRNYLGIPDPRLLRDALNTTENPVLKMFDKVYSNTLEELQRMHRTEGTGKQHLQLIGLDRVIELHNGDYPAIKAYLRLHATKGNPTRLLALAKERTMLYKSRDAQAVSEIEEVRSLLAA